MMNHMDGMGHSDCPFEVAEITNCVQVQNPIAFAVSHLNALSKFFSAIPVNTFASLISTFLLLALAVFIISNKEFELFKLEPLFIRSRLGGSFVPQNKILLTDWFSLHENSPAFIGRR